MGSWGGGEVRGEGSLHNILQHATGPQCACIRTPQGTTGLYGERGRGEWEVCGERGLGGGAGKKAREEGRA